MKFQDDISNMNTYIHTDKQKPICPPLFQSWGHKNWGGVGGRGRVGGGGGQGRCERRIEVFVKIQKKKLGGGWSGWGLGQGGCE